MKRAFVRGTQIGVVLMLLAELAGGSVMDRLPSGAAALEVVGFIVGVAIGTVLLGMAVYTVLWGLGWLAHKVLSPRAS